MKRIVRPRNTGRFGNLLFEYVFWYLLALQYGIIFDNKLDKFPEPFDKVDNYKPKSQPMDLKFPLKLEKDDIPDYPMDMKYYLKYRDLLRTILKVPKLTKAYDIVVHVRLDDVFDPDEPLYTVMPLSFYKAVFENIKKIHGNEKFKILIVGRPVNDIQKKIFNDIYNYIITFSKDVSIQSGTMTEDLYAIMSCKILVGSTSSFWVLPSFLGLCEEVHIPNFGQAKAYKFLRGSKKIKKGLYLNKEENYNVYIYDLKIKKKIMIENIVKMYDV